MMVHFDHDREKVGFIEVSVKLVKRHFEMDFSVSFFILLGSERARGSVELKSQTFG